MQKKYKYFCRVRDNFSDLVGYKLVSEKDRRIIEENGEKITVYDYVLKFKNDNGECMELLIEEEGAIYKLEKPYLEKDDTDEYDNITKDNLFLGEVYADEEYVSDLIGTTVTDVFNTDFSDITVSDGRTENETVGIIFKGKAGKIIELYLCDSGDRFRTSREEQVEVKN